MADTFTTNLNLTKPEPGAAEDTWGISLNSDLDTLDAIFSSSGTQINLNPNQVNFADNKKAIFGAGNDLQIYSDGASGVIQQVGSGVLLLKGQDFYIQNDAGENFLRAETDGAVRLYYDNAGKLDTTSTGIDVTGTATMDGLSIKGNTGLLVESNGSANYGVYIESNFAETMGAIGALSQADAGRDGASISFNDFGRGIVFKTNEGASNSEAARITSAGNLMVGGTTTPDTNGISIETSASSGGLSIISPTTGRGDIFFGDTADLNIGQIRYAHSDNSMTFRTNAGDRVVIDSAGNVGIGTTSPSYLLDVRSSTSPVVNIQGADGNSKNIYFRKNTGDTVEGRIKVYADIMSFETGGSEAGRFDASQNFMVGKTSVGVSTTGSEIRADGQVSIVREGDTPLFINRKTSDGNVADFRKDNSTFGTIGVVAGYLGLASGDTGFLFRAPYDDILPYSSTANSAIDNTIDLGDPSFRYKDLYLSGGHMNGAANSFTFVSGGNASNAGANILLYGQSHSSDANTTVFRASGSETARITSAGRLALGTSSPSEDLHISSDTSVALIEGTNNATSGLVAGVKVKAQFYRRAGFSILDESDNEDFFIGRPYASTNQFVITNDGAERLRIDTSGNVGIGTSSPNSALTVAGEIPNSPTGDGVHLGFRANYAQMQLNGSAGGIIDFSTSGVDYVGRILYDQASDYMAFSTNTAERIRIDSSGNFGIGTDSPAAKFDIYHGSSQRLLFTTTGTDNFISSVNGANNAYAGVLLNGSVVKLGTGGSERARITSAGRLGIGTTTPQGKIQVLSGSAPTRANLIIGFNDTSENYYDAGTHVFRDGSSNEKLRIDSSGRLGIGSNSPDAPLTVHSSSDPEIRLGYSSSQDHRIAWDSAKLFLDADPDNQNNNSILGFRVDGSEAGRFDASGNFYVGTTDSTLYSATSGGGIFAVPNGSTTIARQSTSPTQPLFILNETGVNGTLQEFRKDGSIVGNIGVAASDNLYIGASTSGHSGLYFDNGNMVPMSGNFPTDNVIDLGSSVVRFDDIYATNATIQTSDRNEKQDIEELSEAETRVAVAAKGLLKKFKFKSAVAEKGDEARIHFGIIAQDLQDAFTAEGLDASDYAMFCSNTWTDDDGVEQTRLGVRYSELLAFIIAAI